MMQIKSSTVGPAAASGCTCSKLRRLTRRVTAVYDRHTYDAEKRAALDWWDVKLQALLANQEANVLPFSRGA